MKKIATISFALLLMGIMPATASKIYKDKQNGGWFGYKFVEQTDFNNGDTYLKCTDPGWTRCRAQSTARMSYQGQTVDLSVETLENIDDFVMKSVTESNTSVMGKFITKATKENYKLNYQSKNKKYEKNIYHYSSINCI